MADEYFPYLNRGSYKWIPDDYASTSAANFGVTQAYDIPVIDYGRQQNILPELFYNNPEDTQIVNGTSYVGRQAFEIVCRGLRKADGTVDKGGASPNSNIQLYSADPGSVAPYYLASPFMRLGVRRNSRAIAQDIYHPPVADGFGFSSFDLATNPFFFFNTDGMGNGKIASIEIEYTLATGTDWYPEQGDTQLSGAENPPFALIGVANQNTISSGLWWDTSRPQGGDMYWGPPSNPVQQVTDAATLSALSAIELTLGTGQLTGVFLPLYVHSGTDTANTTTFAELGITNEKESFNPRNPSEQAWEITSRRRVNIRLSGQYWTLSDYFPELLGFLICPSWRVMNVQQDSTGKIVPRPDALYAQPFNNGKYGSWNAMVTGLRVYDALQCNAVPQHLETKTIGGEPVPVTVESQLPCQIFGYAWRISQAVMVSAYTPMVQPSRGKVLSSNPGEGFGDRVSTFYFKIYHPDIVGLGVAHGVRFYYGLAVAAQPGTSPFVLAALSLVGIVAGIGTDTDMVYMQYISPLVGQQTLTFQFLSNQHGDPGKAIYSGQFGFAKQTVGVACLKQASPDMILILSTFPVGPTNGTKVLCYDETGTENDNYTFATIDAFGVTNFNQDSFSKTYTGGLTPFIHGAPKTNQSGIGAFDMAVNQSSSFQGPEKISVFAKPKTNNILPGNAVPLSQICNDNNNHLSTFISDERAIGPLIHMYVGNWRLRLVAKTDSSLKIQTQLFFRFGFVPTDIDPSIINGTDLWGHAVEFHFEHQSRDGDTGMVFMAGPPPTTSQVIATPFLTETSIAYDTTWNVLYGADSDPAITVIKPNDPFNKQILFDLAKKMPGVGLVRLVVQVWAANVPVATGAKYNPSTDLNYPAVELSWSGETEANFQTMITEVRSGVILPQQDPYVLAYTVLSYNYLTTQSCGVSQASINADNAASDSQSRAAANGETYAPPPFRDYELWGNFLDLTTPTKNNAYTRFTPPSSGAGGYNGLNAYGLLAHDTDTIINGGRLSVAATRNNVGVLDASKFQYGDMAVFTSDQTSTLVGGSVINPTTIFKVDANFFTNNSLFNAWVYFELLAAGSDDLTSYSLVRTNWFLIDTSGNDGNAEFTGNLTLEASTTAATVITDPNSRLMLRVHVYAFKNRTISTNVSSRNPQNFHSGFTCIDFDGFRISFNGATLDITGGPKPGFSRGNADWYEGLPLTTSRTFGSADYYFVPDAASLVLYSLVPTSLMKTSFWYLYGWMFSPFWFIEMPQGACFEIIDQAGLLQANPNSGSNFSADETSQKAMRVRTAVGTQSVASVSANRQSELLGNESLLARQRIEVGGAASATNFLSVFQNPAYNTPDRGMPEFIVRTGGTNIVSGKNPLIITASPDVQLARRFYGGNAQPRYLFYEDDQFDSDNQQSNIVMLVNYDGTSQNWQNPFGNNFYGSTGKVVFNSDMKMIGGAVDLTDYSLYFAGYRANNFKNTSQGGMIVLKRMNPGLVFGTDSAAVGPLFFVDGQVTEDSWITSMPTAAQVFSPTQDTLNKTVNPGRFNNLGSGGKPLAADESFPDLFVDPRGYIYVFYSLLTTNHDEAKNALGKVFCRESHNSGYWFGEPFPVADLGYNRAGGVINLAPNDTSFQTKHMVVLYNDHTKIYMLFFWAGGKIFMRLLPHPGTTLERFKMVDASKKFENLEPYHNSLNFLYMVEGDTAFTDRKVTSGLEQWLAKQWSEGSDASDTTPSFTEDTYDSYSVSGKSNNWGAKTAGSNVYAAIRILKYNNSSDVPQQRIGAFITSEGEITLYFINAIGNLCYKRIRIYGTYPLFTPTLVVDTSTP